ncbi:uncharacterized protein TNCV_807161 [Trichonephila clavipes]|nr:uncharacterized protein TNCV_807161 [Trichonephila clavipes]
MHSLRDGNAIDILLMTAQINSDLMNHPVPLITEPSTSLVRVETDACKSITNSILRYKDYDSHKIAPKDFQKRFVDNRSFYDRFWFRDDLRTSVAEHKNILPEINLEDTLKHATNADKVLIGKWFSFIPNVAVLFVDVAIQPEVRFIAKQNSLMEIGNNGNLVLDPFDESTPRLMIVLMNCQTKLRINHLTAVKSVAILEILYARGGHLFWLANRRVVADDTEGPNLF